MTKYLYIFTFIYTLFLLPFRLLYAISIVLIGWSNSKIEEYEDRFKDFTK